jgi:hypothetical protein
LTQLARTLVASGFGIDEFDRGQAHATYHCRRVDEFGVGIPYAVSLCEGDLDTNTAAVLVRAARRRGAAAVVIADGCGDDVPTGLAVLAWDQFVARFGGPVRLWLPLEPDFGDHLVQLGENRLPAGLTGKADDLFELYAHAALQFVLNGRVHRYGQERLFERVPDGIGLGRDDLTFLYDAKAAKDGYDVSADTVRQFGEYVRRFNARYAKYGATVYAFLLISSTFVQGRDALEDRSADLYRECGVRLCYCKSADLAAITGLVAARPVLRGVIDWKAQLSRTFLTAKRVQDDAQSVAKDKIVGA